MIANSVSEDDYIPNFSYITAPGLIQSRYAIPLGGNLKIFASGGLKQPARNGLESLGVFT